MARPFGRDRRGSNSSSNFKLQSGGRTRSSKKRGKTKERLLLVVGLVVVVLIVLRKEVTKKKKKNFSNQKLEQGKNNQKGLGLDPRRNHQNHQQQLHFHHHQHNQNQTQNQILISRQVVEGEEKEEQQQEQEKEASEKEEQSSFHGLHNQYFQQAQEFHQQHRFLYGGGLESQSSPSQQPPPQPPKKRSYLPSSSSQTKEYASGLRGKMGDTTTTSQNHQTTTTSSRLGGLRNTGVVGEIVEVQGGHIVRSTGRKDRHSKVCTAKGPRDRRVRLSAHTAIQFYDVQDRLGYDRPSKAVDWLIKKAKAAIDELEELPAWTPTANSIPINPPNSEQEDQNHNQHHQQQLQHQQLLHHSIDVGSTSNARRLNDQQQQPTENNSNFLPPSMVSDSIADTIKSFFPMGASTETTSSSAAANIQFHHNFPPPDLLSRTSSQSQDLRLSLQSFQDPMLLHHHNHQNQHQHHQQNEQAAGLFSGNPQIGFDGSSWSENPPGEMGRFQRLVSWNAGGDTCHSGGGGGAFVFNSPPAPPAQPLFGQSHQLFSQRGPLQSSNTPSFRAWIDQSAFSAGSDHQNQASLPFHPSSISGIGFASGGGFSSFRIPARIQGEEEEHDGISDKPSSASSDSRH